MVWDEIQAGTNNRNSSDSRISEVMEVFAQKAKGMSIMWMSLAWTEQSTRNPGRENATMSSTIP